MYKYKEIRPDIFTEEGQVTFLKMRDHLHFLLKQAGAARASEIMACCTGDTWLKMACLDRMVEMGEIREITEDKCAGQHRIFVKKGE